MLPISSPGPAHGCSSVTSCTRANCNTSQLHHLCFCSNRKTHFSPKSTNIPLDPCQFSDCWQDGWIYACPVCTTRTASDLHVEDSLLFPLKLPKKRNKRNWSNALTLLSKPGSRGGNHLNQIKRTKNPPKIQKELENNAAVSQRADPLRSQYVQEEIICQATRILGWKPEDNSEKIFPLPPSSHQQASPPSYSVLVQSLTGEERRWELQMRSSCTLPAPLSTTQLSTPNVEPEAESTAKREEEKLFRALAHPHCITIHCLEIWVSQQPRSLLYSQNRRGYLPSLLSKLIG